MKNAEYFPFERNKYFYGKLLSVDDFELEQKYMNNKRRMINRFLYGTGVIAGLQVIRVDDMTISVEMGAALDFSGREIVVDAPVMKKLSLIEGFDSYQEANSNLGALYLCLEYAEKEIEAVHNIVGNTVYVSDKVEYNKVKEGYRLFLTDQEPENNNLSVARLYEDIQTIYSENGIRIKQIIPRFVQTGQEFILKIEIENMGQQQSFAFSYGLELTCLTWQENYRVKVSFDEMLVEKSKRYQMEYVLKALEVTQTDGIIKIEPDSFRLSIEQRRADAKAEGQAEIKIISQMIEEEMIDCYYQTAMENILRSNFQQSIYLAKIFLIKAGDTYVIDTVENLPFHQQVVNNVLSAAQNHLLLKELKRLPSYIARNSNINTAEETKTNINSLKIAQGKISISLKEKAEKGKRYFSKPISHGLGIGPATVILSVINEEKKIQMFGSKEIFPRIESIISTAAKLDYEKGTLTIGIKFLAPTEENQVSVYWTVIKDIQEELQEKPDQKIFIKPNVLNLKTRESHYLEVVLNNMNDKRIQWSVKENGGNIDKNGLYTAPNQAGVYEVMAQSVAYPEIKASIFVVVRESENNMG